MRDYVRVARLATENARLRSANADMRRALAVLQTDAARLDDALDLSTRADQALRALVLPSTQPKMLSMGPTEEPALGPARVEPRVRDGNDDPAALDLQLARLAQRARRSVCSHNELQVYFSDQRSRLSATPSIWPMRGTVSSGFGGRVDPINFEAGAHPALDIAGPEGNPVMATAFGTVLFAGLEGGYGNVIVIDHGYGIKTRYAHLSKLDVRPGEKVVRGQTIGAAGSTGHSTGPHLHYEVRIWGAPQDPSKFILDDGADAPDGVGAAR